jgi:hypothetical protein
MELHVRSRSAILGVKWSGVCRESEVDGMLAGKQHDVHHAH